METAIIVSEWWSKVHDKNPWNGIGQNCHQQTGLAKLQHPFMWLCGACWMVQWSWTRVFSLLRSVDTDHMNCSRDQRWRTASSGDDDHQWIAIWWGIISIDRVISRTWKLAALKTEPQFYNVNCTEWKIIRINNAILPQTEDLLREGRG